MKTINMKHALIIVVTMVASVTIINAEEQIKVTSSGMMNPINDKYAYEIQAKPHHSSDYWWDVTIINESKESQLIKAGPDLGEDGIINLMEGGKNVSSVEIPPLSVWKGEIKWWSRTGLNKNDVHDFFLIKEYIDHYNNISSLEFEFPKNKIEFRCTSSDEMAVIGMCGTVVTKKAGWIRMSVSKAETKSAIEVHIENIDKSDINELDSNASISNDKSN